MEFLLGGEVESSSSHGEININLPHSSHILQNGNNTNLNMSINAPLTNLQLNNIW